MRSYKEYYQRNKEKMQARSKKYYDEHREERIEYKRKRDSEIKKMKKFSKKGEF